MANNGEASGGTPYSNVQLSTGHIRISKERGSKVCSIFYKRGIHIFL
jgi:hypothetical protein